MSLSKSLLPLFFSLTLSVSWLLGAPAVTLVSPNFGPAAGGETVTITGTGFTGVTDVKFGPTSGTIVTSSDTQITVQTPQSVPGTVHISVTVGADTSPTTPADRYTYQGNWFAYVAGSYRPIQSPSTPTAWYINLANNQIEGDITLLQQDAPLGIAITPDGRTVYVGDQSSQEKAAQPKGTSTYVNAIDVILNTPTAIECNGHLNSLFVAISPDGTTVYPTFGGENKVGLIDVATQTLTGTISSTGDNPTGIAISPNGKKIYVADGGGPSVTVFEEGVFSKTIHLSGRPTLIAITPDGSEVYVTANSNQIYVIDTLSDELKQTITIPGIHNFRGIAISPDGRFVYICDADSTNVYQINCSTKQIENTIDCDASYPRGIFIAPDGKTAYVVVNNDLLPRTYAVKVIDLTQNPPVVVDTISFPATDSFNQISITPDPSPAAEFSVTVGAAGSPTAFDASRSVTAVGTVVQYVWNFGDGSPEETTTAPTVSHTYAQGGTYTVGLTVTNSAGTSVAQTFTGQTVSNNGSFDNAHFEQVITIQSSSSLKRPHHFRGKIHKHHHHLKLTTEWKRSHSSGKVKYQIFEDHKKIYTTKKLHFKKSLHPKDYYKDHLHDYKKFLEHRYSVRAVNPAGAKSPFTHLDME